MRVCESCGCSDLAACVYETTTTRFACFWVEGSLCSFCALGYLDDRELQAVRGVDVVTVSGGVL